MNTATTNPTPGAVNVLLTLQTADGCTGWRWLSDADGPMAWDREPDAETTGATFEQYSESGALVDEHDIDGDEWRDLEDSGEVERVIFWVRNCCPLAMAVTAAQEGCDPDGFDREAAEAMEELREERAAAAAQVEALREHNAALVLLVLDVLPHGIGEHEFTRAGGWRERAQALTSEGRRGTLRLWGALRDARKELARHPDAQRDGSPVARASEKLGRAAARFIGRA